MTLKEVAKRCIPPIAADAIRWVLRGKGGAAPSEPAEMEYVADGWRIRGRHIKSLDVESILEIEKAKWPEFLRLVQGSGPLGIAREEFILSNTDQGSHNTLMTYAYVVALAAHKKDRLSVLDWGGSIGHYYVLSKALLPDVEIDYHCKDFRRFCQYGRELFPKASFYESEEEYLKQSYDLVLASGSLQCLEDWRTTVGRLASISRPYLLVTRLPVVQAAASFVVLHRTYRNGFNTEYLCWFLNRDEFLDHMKSVQMELVREFLLHGLGHVHEAPEQGELRGFLFRTRGGDTRG